MKASDTFIETWASLDDMELGSMRTLAEALIDVLEERDMKPGSVAQLFGACAQVLCAHNRAASIALVEGLLETLRQMPPGVLEGEGT